LNIVFGTMPKGKHVALTEFSIASCVGNVWLAGDAHVHADVNHFSKLNLFACRHEIVTPISIDYLLNSNSYAIIEAHGTTFSGEATLKGIGCNKDSDGRISKPSRGFPATEPGNC
jgi:hypothetical protein